MEHEIDTSWSLFEEDGDLVAAIRIPPNGILKYTTEPRSVRVGLCNLTPKEVVQWMCRHEDCDLDFEETWTTVLNNFDLEKIRSDSQDSIIIPDGEDEEDEEDGIVRNPDEATFEWFENNIDRIQKMTESDGMTTLTRQEWRAYEFAEGTTDEPRDIPDDFGR